MKKIILILTLLFVSFSQTYAYNLNLSEKLKVENAAETINGFIERKGEKYRPILISRIDEITKRNIGGKNRAIFTLLGELLKKESEDTVESKIDVSPSIEAPIQQKNEEEEVEKEIEILDSDFNFIYEHDEFECSGNPCTTTENAIKIVGVVDNEVIEYIEVNGYRLKSYQGSTWEYNPNIAYNNFTDGENTYAINYLDENEIVVYSEEFVINKGEPEVEETQVAIENNTSSIAPTYSVDSSIPNVDENAVRQYWLDLINGERTNIGLSPYTYDPSLDKTAKIWSDLAVSRGYIDHKVNSPSDSYYDYWKKAAWMENNGVACKNISRITFSESIAWNIYTCTPGTDCTEGLKSAVKSSFDFYMSEKGQSYSPHYDALAHPTFQTMGLGISVQNQGNNRYKMYLTNHYCTTNTL